jgi:hypothetical protein
MILSSMNGYSSDPSIFHKFLTNLNKYIKIIIFETQNIFIITSRKGKKKSIFLNRIIFNKK